MHEVCFFWGFEGILAGEDMILCSKKKGAEEKDCPALWVNFGVKLL